MAIAKLFSQFNCFLICAVFTLVLISNGCYGDMKSGWGSNEATTTKPGECPASDTHMQCFEQKDLCNSDCECAKKQTCCFQDSCGRSCKEPTVIIEEVATGDEKIATSTKPGMCPEPLNNIRCVKCHDQCKSDCECEAQVKCCPQPGCGNWCRNATQIG